MWYASDAASDKMLCSTATTDGGVGCEPLLLLLFFVAVSSLVVSSLVVSSLVDVEG